MFVRLSVLTFAVLLACASSDARADARWQRVATPPRAGLPVVEVDLGYEGMYVAARNSPIVLRARAAAKPFDGYIGYRIAVGEKGTVDVPVVSRAVLAPRQAWTFSTTLQLRSSPPAAAARREVVIEWRDRALKVVAKQSVGVPPWANPSRPLRIVGEGEQVTDPTYGGWPAVLLPPVLLSAQPQWYSGFSSIFVPTDVWFTLAQPIRAAIFASGAEVVFFGIPAQVPRTGEVDRALLPVNFRNGEGSLVAPWPYDQAGRTRRTTVAWTAVNGAATLGSPALPYLVATGAGIFVAGEEGARDPFPALGRAAVVPFRPGAVYAGPRLVDILDQVRPILAVIVAALICIVVWLTMRRRPRFASVLAAGIIVFATLGARDYLGLNVESYRGESALVSAPGVIERWTFHGGTGMVPHVTQPKELSGLAGSVTRGGKNRADAEIRTSATPPGFGAMWLRGRSWISVERYSTRRERAAGPQIQVRAVGAEELVVNFESATPVDYVTAVWIAHGKRNHGMARIPRASRGRAVVRARRFEGNVERRFGWTDMSKSPGDLAQVRLLRLERDRSTMIEHAVPMDGSSHAVYRMYQPLSPDDGGNLTAAFALRPGPVPQEVELEVRNKRYAGQVTLEGAAGAVVADLAQDSPWSVRAKLGSDALQRVAPQGGVVIVRLSGAIAAGLEPGESAILKVTEKR